MVASIQSELTSGNYAAAIQDALGNAGTSAEMRISGSRRSVVVTGAATNEPSSYAPAPAAIISFSPAAQSILSNSEIALDVLNATAGIRSVDAAKSTLATPRTAGDQAVQPPLQEPVDQTAPSAAKPSVSQIVQEAQQSLNDPTAAFYNMVKQQGGPVAYASLAFAPNERQSFIDAFNNRTLTTQNAADVPGLNYQDNTALTGTSEAVHVSYNETLISDQMAAGTISGVITLPLVGGIYIAWANTSAGSTSEKNS